MYIEFYRLVCKIYRLGWKFYILISTHWVVNFIRKRINIQKFKKSVNVTIIHLCREQRESIVDKDRQVAEI